MTYISYDPAFAAVIGPHPQFETIPNVRAHEGPVYVREENALYFTTVPVTTNVPAFGDRNVEIGRLDVATGEVTTFLPASNMANGMTLGSDGRLLVCEQGSFTTAAQIGAISLRDKRHETIVDRWFALPFNSPNDVVVKKSDGTIWFTDPSYGALQGFRNPPLSGDYVYRFDPADGSTRVVADSFNKPNGLAFSRDESILYVNDSGAIQGPGTYDPTLPHHIRAFDVLPGGNLGSSRLFAVITPGIPDGLKVDSEDRVYSSSFSGVQVFDRHGKILGEIVAPGVANFCFGGERNDTLFMMCDSEIRIAVIAATGA